LDGEDRDLGLTRLSPGLIAITGAGRRFLARVARMDARWFVHLDGATIECEIISPASGHGGRGGASGEDLSVPMPGVVTQVLVREGDQVSPGQPLVIVEAMKMEHVVRARQAGRVRAVRVREEERVEAGAAVVDLDPGPGAGAGEGAL
jgi:biotin carboxyl carrier protein